MTLDEARQILGIAEDADARALRRAYLRRIKQHSPERDPEGFMRVRQAFELAELWASQERPSSRSDVAVPSVLPDLVRLEAPPDSARAPDAALDARVRSVQAFRQRLAEAQSKLADDDVRAILREALEQGHAEFVLEARRLSPEVLSDSQLADWLDEQLHRPDGHWANLAGALLVRGRVRDAMRIGLASLAARRGAPELAQGAQLEYEGTTFTLDLFARGFDVEAARFGGEYLAVRDPLSFVDPLRFEALRELLDVHTRLPRDVVIAIASALRDHQPGQIDEVLADFRASYSREARAARSILERAAPMLFGLFGPALLGGSAKTVIPDRPSRLRWKHMAVLAILLGVLRLRCEPRDWPAPSRPLERVRRGSELEREQYLSALATCESTPAPICQLAMRWAEAADCIAMKRGASQADAEATRARGERQVEARLETMARYIVKETRAQCGASMGGNR